MNLSFDAFSAALQQPAASKERFIFFSEARKIPQKGKHLRLQIGIPPESETSQAIDRDTTRKGNISGYR